MSFKDEARGNKRGRTTWDYVDKALRELNQKYDTPAKYNAYVNITNIIFFFD